MDDLFLVLVFIVPTVVLSVWWALRPTTAQTIPEPTINPEILFKNGLVEHANDAALAMLPITAGGHDWRDLHDILKANYPDFPLEPSAAPSPDTIVEGRKGQPHNLRIIWRAQAVSLIFEMPHAPLSSPINDTELDTLRQINALSPHPAWKTDQTGSVVWSNPAYRNLIESLPNVTRGQSEKSFDLPPFSGKMTTNRIKVITTESDMPEWFDVARTSLSDGIVHQATSLTALIKAEDAQREFVQTLAKTFAHLSIGLAIFNRDRQLALFNPALVDLTGLSVSFLSPRPTIDSFFDALRENRRMPEPKNYNTWRQRMADLVSAAETGRFEETWTLETGQTYNIKGRPHPDGAIAFLFEDISAEVSLTRTFRAELELGQSLVDTFEDALAVFSQSGILTFSNKAYDVLWGFQFDTSFADVTIIDAIRMWRERSAPNPLWQELHDAVMALDDREEWEMPVNINGQVPMKCKIVPIASGATVVRFSTRPVVNTLRIPRADKTLT